MKTWKWQQRIIAHENKMTLVELAEATIFAAGVAGSDQLDSRDSWEADYLQSKLMERLAHIEKRLAEPHPFNGTATGSGGQVFVTCSRDPMLDGVRICPSGYVAEFMKEEEK